MIEHWMTTGLLGANASFQRAAREYAEEYAAMAVARTPLTDEQIEAIWKAHVLPGFGDRQKFYSPVVYARAIEAAHGIGGLTPEFMHAQAEEAPRLDLGA